MVRFGAILPLPVSRVLKGFWKMEAEEEFQDGEAFRLLIQFKRSKTVQVIVKDGKEEENLLNSNKFSPLKEKKVNNNNPAAESSKSKTKAPSVHMSSDHCSRCQSLP